MNELLFKLAIQLRAMQLFYHSSHLHSARVAFFSDHSAFGDFYSECEGHYDGSAERLIGLFGSDSLNLQNLMHQVNIKLTNCPSNTAKDNGALFQYGLQMENDLLALCGAIDKHMESSAGTRNLIGDIADKSEARVYKIKQRLKK